jgi:hypothetical protein
MWGAIAISLTYEHVDNLVLFEITLYVLHIGCYDTTNISDYGKVLPPF